MERNDFFNGVLVGFIQTVVGHPFDTYKAIKQTSIKNIHFRDYTIKRLYKGFIPPFLGSGLFNSVQFGFHEYFYKKNYSHFMAGFIGGALSSIVVSPVDMYKINYQLLGKTQRQLFRGFYSTLLRESIAPGIYFGSYFYIKDNYIDSSFISGGSAGVMSWIFTYPIDTVKTRIMSYNARNYKNAIAMGNLWRGIEFCLLRAFIVNGVGFAMFNLIQ